MTLMPTPTNNRIISFFRVVDRGVNASAAKHIGVLLVSSEFVVTI